MDNLKNIQKEILQFRKSRDWEQFHTVKDLLLGLNIEVGELQELVLWKTPSDYNEIDRNKVGNEIADIFIFVTYLCKEFDIDLSKAVKDKLLLNEEKYPIEKSKGSNKKYTDL